MDYKNWIERERKIRLKLLEDSNSRVQNCVYRICSDCSEICLCYEFYCPNCNSTDIEKLVLSDNQNFIEKRIRCLHRFKQLVAEDSI